MRISFVRLLLAVLAASLVLTPSVEAKTKTLKQTYSAYYYAVKHKHGSRAPGRNVRRYGIRYDVKANGKRGPWASRDATYRELATSIRQLRTLLRPAGRYLSVSARPPSQAPAGVMTASVHANLPDCTWRPESGGNYAAYNSSSGAYGKYQIIPSTWAAHCSDLNRGPGGQERCAARVYQAQGAGAWVNC